MSEAVAREGAKEPFSFDAPRYCDLEREMTSLSVNDDAEEIPMAPVNRQSVGYRKWGEDLAQVHRFLSDGWWQPTNGQEKGTTCYIKVH